MLANVTPLTITCNLQQGRIPIHHSIMGKPIRYAFCFYGSNPRRQMTCIFGCTQHKKYWWVRYKFSFATVSFLGVKEGWRISVAIQYKFWFKSEAEQSFRVTTPWNFNYTYFKKMYMGHEMFRSWARSQNCEKRLLASSVRMEQLGSHWKDFDEIWYFRLFRKPVEKIQVSLKSDKNNGYFIWRRFHIYDNISLISSYNEKWFK